MTVATGDLVRDLQRQVRTLEDDLRQQVEQLPEVKQRLEADFADAKKRGRTAESWTSWLDAQATQSAVSWVLGCVFVRFCEDNDLTERRWLAGIGDGLGRAVDAQATWIQQHPRENERGWLRDAYGWLRSTRAGASLFPHTDFVWWWDISADAASGLVEFFRRRGGDGDLVHRLDSPDWDTRFLGDLYQDLSEAARKRYALLQTPEFVEEFILDLTLDPALEEFGIEELRMIDPACGSGHFVLGTFRRLLEAWARHAPAMDTRSWVQKALDAVHGVDVNAGATAIAKFRLMVAALKAAEVRRLDGPDAPAFTLHIATGDSLLRGASQQALAFEEGDPLVTHAYGWEDIDAHPGILDPGRYQVVVGNPPYITVKDRALNAAYREHYATCHRKYQLSVPFAELFFRLARSGSETAGYVGQINSNAFMKREFGKPLVEDFFARLDLSHVIDTSGAYIPGHGTPTAVLIGRNRPPRTSSIRTVMGIRGEPGEPADPSRGAVWASILEMLDTPGEENSYITVADVERGTLATHPWSLSGGGASGAFALVEGSAATRLGDHAARIGFFGITGADELLIAPRHVWARRSFALHRPHVAGEQVRDWTFSAKDEIAFPYVDGDLVSGEGRDFATFYWPYRTTLGARRTFSGSTYAQEGRPWWEWHQLPADREASSLLLTFAFVASHNHFAMADDSETFNKSATLVRFPKGVSEESAHGWTGCLNSSTGCFWLKQVSYPKGGDPVGREGARVSASGWDDRYEFTGTKLQEFPLPRVAPLQRSKRLSSLARELRESTPAAVCDVGVPTRESLAAARERFRSVRLKMIAVQEELDWETYRLYGLLDEDLTYSGADLPELQLGERAFEILLARKLDAGEEETEWFERHRSTPIIEVPRYWHPDYRRLVERRIDAINSHQFLHLMERPECKRRWGSESWEDMQADALHDLLLNRLETESLWCDDNGPRTLSVAQLADAVRSDGEFRQVLDLYVGRPDYDLAKEVSRLVRDEAVPYLATHRYKPAGMRKRIAWERTWARQREEDRSGRRLEMDAPPRYATGDFQSTEVWRARGKLDVPKERFISYPGTERAGDTTFVLGWAGWDHLQQAQALARLVLDRQSAEGWAGAQLREPLAGLLELEPWLHQWHADGDPLYGGSPADFYTAFLDEQAHAAGLSRQQLRPLAAMPEVDAR